MNPRNSELSKISCISYVYMPSKTPFFLNLLSQCIFLVLFIDKLRGIKIVILYCIFTKKFKEKIVIKAQNPQPSLKSSNFRLIFPRGGGVSPNLSECAPLLNAGVYKVYISGGKW